ncbi:capsid scaffolding protein [Thermus phage phiFa]|nr:capsid scaffolding protein [Thermus phage phiFa]
MSDKTDRTLLLFTEQGEVTSPLNFEEDPDVQPLFSGNKVSKPVVILVEGTYIGYTPSGRAVEVKYDRAFLEAIVKNTRRDVPLNYEHYRYGPNTVGWVRVKTGKFYVDKLPDGRHALFAQLEVTPEAYDHITNGRYRDMSPEVDRGKKRLVGLALTNYPAIDALHQFSMPEEVEEMEQEVVKTDEVKKEEPALFAEQLQALQAKLAELEERLRAEQRRAERAERLLQFSERLERFQGKIPAGVKPVLVELYLFAAEHDDQVVQFSDAAGEQVKATPTQLIDMLLEGLAVVNYTEQVVSEGAEVAEPDFDPSYVAAVESIAKRKL